MTKTSLPSAEPSAGVEFKDHFSSLAGQYAASRPRYPAALFEYLADAAPRRQCAWDCACGSGQATLSLAEHFERVVATDASAEQIAAAPAHARVAYSVASAEWSGLETASADLIIVAQALHWFDLDSFYREAERVLRPAGLLAVWSYGVCTIEGEAVDRRAQRFYHMLDRWWPPERSIVEDGYRTLPFPFTELPAPELRLEVSWSLPELLGYFRSWSAVGRYLADRGEDPVRHVEAELAAVWGEPQSRRTVTWPLGIRVGRTRGRRERR